MALLCGAPIPAWSQSPTAIEARTEGGLREGTRVLHVTTLADSGPGSLREALTARGPRVVVFDVSGYLDLASRIDIRTGNLTVAGQTAPDPGVVVRGAAITVRTSDVRIEHIAIYPGLGPPGSNPSGIDALGLVSRADRQREVHRVVLRNLTLAHASDENLSVAGDAVGEVRVESSILGPALRNTGHPRGNHNLGLLIYPNVRNLSVVGNLFANNDARNPVINPGVEAVVANNLVFGYGRNSIHVQRGAARLDLRTAIRGNVVMPTPESTCGLDPVQVPERVFRQAPAAVLYLDDNVIDARFARDQACARPPGLEPGARAALTPSPPVEDREWRLLPSTEVRSHVLQWAGMRPGRRHPMDAALMRRIADGTARMIDRMEDVGGWPDAPGTARRAAPPGGDQPRGPAALRQLAAWLCDQHRAVGGSPNGDCPAGR